MKVTLNWLKQYVEFDWTPDELGQRLTMLGVEVEGIQKISGEFEGVFVAQVVAFEKHPNADKLSVCRVADGRGERQIVCGATNFKAGDKVPLILPGASLPAKPGQAPFTIKVGKIRGVESHGMLCSPAELGLSEDVAGLLILPQDAKVGQPFSEHLGRSSGDVVYDLEITPNRPDLNSLIGIAREISAVSGNPLKLPAAAPEENGPKVNELVAVRIDAPELCPRYTARVISGVKVCPSPAWLRQALEKVGLRSINNVVDVTNFVMLETGQPLHAFDYHLVAKGTGGVPTVVIRCAVQGETFVTLDGQKRPLTAQMLLIADEVKGIGLAGVMGGQNTEINDQTTDVLLESAYFKPQNIRATSKALELRTDASYRFERGADVGICDWASRRAAQLILETGGGRLAPGVVDAYPSPWTPRQVALRPGRVTSLLGVDIPASDQLDALRRLGLDPVEGSAQDPAVARSFRIPSFRVDIKREADLIEEVARLYGADRIPATPPRGAIGANAYDREYDELAEARRLLAGLGLYEAQGQTLISESAAKLVAGVMVPLSNPISGDMNVLRPSLLPGLIESLRRNLNHQNLDVGLFELGRVFVASDGQPKECRRLAVALTGQRSPTFWSGEQRGAKADIHDLKGIVEEFLEQFGLKGASYARRSESPALYVESASVQMGRLLLGEIGQLHPTLAKQYDLRDPVLLAELDLDQLLARRNAAKSLRPLPAFPSIRRDVAMVVADAVTHDTILGTVKQAKPPHLEQVELFDVFRGKNVPPGHKSMAYAFTYRNPERTLTDAEVNSAHEKLVERFKQGLSAVIRDA